MHLIYVVEMAVKYSRKMGEGHFSVWMWFLYYSSMWVIIKHKLSILMDNETWILCYSGGWGRRITELGQSGQLK